MPASEARGRRVSGLAASRRAIDTDRAGQSKVTVMQFDKDAQRNQPPCADRSSATAQAQARTLGLRHRWRSSWRSCAERLGPRPEGRGGYE